MNNKTQQKTSQLWKMNDGKAQKNGSHSNIYWVRVTIKNNLEATFKLRWLIEA